MSPQMRVFLTTTARLLRSFAAALETLAKDSCQA